MKKGLISAAIMACFLLSVLVVSGAFAAKDEVVLKAPNGDVKFNHKKHAETMKIDCVKCHHTWKPGETTGKLCVECHKAKAEGKTPSAKDAFHKDCQDCHKKDKEAKKQGGPTVCTGCHKKAK
jgi:Class III cytochrome C family